LLALFLSANYALQKQDKNNPFPITWDVFGYYLYLPAVIVHHDLGIQNAGWLDEIYKKYNPSSTKYQYTNGQDGKQVIVYNPGYAFLFSPGFMVANQIADGKDFLKDGFSKPYQLALLITCILISMVGVYMTRKIALEYFDDLSAAVLMICVLIGSNYFFQAAFDNAMPHNILYTINCLILWHTIKWHKNSGNKHLVLLAFWLGLATICRPVEILWILVPLFWNVGNRTDFIDKIYLLIKQYKALLISGMVLVAVIYIQFAYTKYATGYYKAINLHNETFDFLHPFTFDFLFSYKKGWLLYTPIMWVGLASFILLFKQRRKLFLSHFSFLFIFIYVVSSWQCWWYASSYSQRPMVESYAIMILPFGFFIQWVLETKKKLRMIFFSSLLTLLILHNLFQIYQFNNNLIDGQRMTKTYYWKVFGKTETDNETKKYLSVNREEIKFDSTQYTSKQLILENFEGEDWQGNKMIIDTMAFSGEHSQVLTSENSFSKTVEMEYQELSNKSYCWIDARIKVYAPNEGLENNSHLIISFESMGKSYKYHQSNYSWYNIKPNDWNVIDMRVISPEILHPWDKVKIYFWNNGSKNIFIDDFKVMVYEPLVDYK
jgi:hypothetical protein